ncbi:PREDICTED: uncharacterized protein LOC109585178 [Amphimedon queenslandica]|uniref:EH domain-containing protein n=3 Tax=Amphimedon queenslandica TaxID=400682 RepID=A0AAN0JIU6_AMPQE|nr:PREDICTED: uncharacterized protein LOC109585178 [Amphimedon queenslandica]|eukprot:XP_019856721.1 PREDICTED: uncharacterized protein LOC109585178 [Amphimedon queenslandica]
MSGLGDAKPNQCPLTKSDFKSTPPIRGIETRPFPVPLNKTYSVSTKAAKVWEKGGEELSGLFKTETSGGTNEISFSPGSDDGFGDFQSVTSNTVTSNSVLASAAGRERVGGGGIRRALPLMTSPAVGSPVLVHYQSGGPPVMATTSSIQSPSLPTWLVSPTVELPDVYKEVYKRCSINGSQFTHTESLFPLLISSDLDRSVLHDLWSAVNLTSPGQLTQTELYQLLGLIGLAQNRQNVKVTLHDLLMTPSPPVPTLKAINIINTSNEDDFCEFKASPLVPHKFDGVGSVGVASTPPTTQPASDPSDPYSALRVLAPPTNNDPGTQGLLTINKEPATQQQQNQQQIDQQRHHDQQHQILHQQQEQLPVINTDVQPSTGDGWADFTSFPDTSQPLATPSIDTTTSSNIINMMNPTTTPVVVGGGPVSGGVAPAGASDGLIWSDDEFTEFSTYQSQDVSVAEPVLSSPSHTIGRGGGGGGGIVSPSPTSPMSSTSTDSNKSIGLSEIWCQCLQKCLDLLKDSQSLLTSSSNDEETLNIIINEREGEMKIKGLAELYRFAKRLHTSSRGQGKSLMSHSKSKRVLSIKNLRVQAYGSSDGFSDKCSHCYQDSTGKAFIPIVVGSVIGGLVLVVLVSYIVGRFRNHYKKSSSTGYEKLQ